MTSKLDRLYLDTDIQPSDTGTCQHIFINQYSNGRPVNVDALIRRRID